MQPEANELFTLFKMWLRRQFVLLGREADADALAMHLLARSQGVATLASAFHDAAFIRQEVDQMCTWQDACAEGTARRPDNWEDADKPVGRRGTKKLQGRGWAVGRNHQVMQTETPSSHGVSAGLRA